MSENKINLAEFANMLGGVKPRKHNYYSPKSGQFAARFIENWKKIHNFQPTTISAHGTGKSVGSIMAQMRYGLEWLSECAEPAEVRAYFIELRPRIKMKVNDSAIDFECITDPLESLRASDDNSGLELRAELLGWVELAKAPRQKWERTGIKLTDENLQWFVDKIRELEERGYCGVAKRDHVVIINYPKNLLLGDTGDQP